MLHDLEINGIWQAAGWLCVSNQTFSVSPTNNGNNSWLPFRGYFFPSHCLPWSSLVTTSGLVNFSLTFLLDASTEWCVWFSSVVWCVCVCVCVFSLSQSVCTAGIRATIVLYKAKIPWMICQRLYLWTISVCTCFAVNQFWLFSVMAGVALP